MKNKKKIFIGLTEVSGYYLNLKKGLDTLGVYSEYITLHSHPFQYGEVECQSLLPKAAQYCVSRRVALSRRNYIGRIIWLMGVLMTRFPLFLWAIFKFDVFILGGGSSFFRMWELVVLRLARKRIIYMCHGTDSRPGYMDGFCVGIDEETNAAAEQLLKEGGGDDKALNRKFIAPYVKSTLRRYRDISMIEKYSNVVINHSAHAHFLTKPFISSVIIGLPFSKEHISIDNRVSDDCDSVRILHSPSQKEGKGTYQIRDAIQTLKTLGYNIKYIEISGRPNSEVLEELSKCDFVIDQLYSDYPLAGFATEAAFYGKPAIVGGYYAEDIKNDIPNEYIPPSVLCLPDDIVTTIEKLIVDKEYRIKEGEKARDFVEKKWQAKAVAERYLKLINDEIPNDWYFDPKNTNYYSGIGQNLEKTQLIIRTIIKEYGVQALKLSKSPALEKRVVDFACSNDG